MAHDLEELWKSSSLSEEETKITTIRSEASNEKEKAVKHCLVGKVLATKVANKDAFRSTMVAVVWSLMKDLVITDIGENTFLLQFASDLDKQ